MTDLPSPSVEGGEPSTDPVLGDGGYPSEQELQRIRDWPWEGGFRSLMAYIRERWQYADVGYWEQHGDRFEISTGGWSGNESIIGALEENQMFSMLCPWSWRRGGHYVYDVREWAEQDGKRVIVRDPATPDEARASEQAAPLLDVAIRALETIKRDEGKVCEQYESCIHRSCASSYAAWAIADATLSHLARLAEREGA